MCREQPSEVSYHGCCCCCSVSSIADVTSSTMVWTRIPYWQDDEGDAWNLAKSTRTPCLFKAGFPWVSIHFITERNVDLRFPCWTRRSWALRPAIKRYQVVGGTNYKRRINSLRHSSSAKKRERQSHTNRPGSKDWSEYHHFGVSNRPCNFLRLQRVKALEIFD